MGDPVLLWGGGGGSEVQPQRRCETSPCPAFATLTSPSWYQEGRHLVWSREDPWGASHSLNPASLSHP